MLYHCRPSDLPGLTKSCLGKAPQGCGMRQERLRWSSVPYKLLSKLEFIGSCPGGCEALV